MLGGAAALALRKSGFAAGVAAPVANTSAGKVRGFLDDGVMVFKGVPYGADTAARRFMQAVKPAGWAGVRECVEFGVRAPQPGGRGMMGAPQHGYHLPPELGDVGEDCLRLNVWTAGLRDGRKRPVIVYIHGGAYSGGSGNNNLYDGGHLVKRGDAVVVTLTHRLNIFGYMYLAKMVPELADSGNVGQLDLVLALEWVRDNIAEFGGDAGRVTIFGQSGGGAKCATLMAMPAAKGLFHRVMTMSGQQITGTREDHADERARAVLKALDLTVARAGEIRKMPLEKLIPAARAGGYMGPVKDGRALPRDPFEPDAPGISAHVPMIIGTTHDETRGLIGSGDPSTFELNWETLPAKLSIIKPFTGELKPEQIVARYREIYPKYSASDVFFAATTAFRSWRGAVMEAERRAVQPGAARHTWVYEMDWRSPVDGGKFGAPHTVDIPFMFDNTGRAPGACGDDASAPVLATKMSEMLLAYAATGDPNCEYLPAWPVFDEKRRATMVFDRETRVVDDPRGAERKFAAQAPYTQPGT